MLSFMVGTEVLSGKGSTCLGKDLHYGRRFRAEGAQSLRPKPQHDTASTGCLHVVFCGATSGPRAKPENRSSNALVFISRAPNAFSVLGSTFRTVSALLMFLAPVPEFKSSSRTSTKTKCRFQGPLKSCGRGCNKAGARYTHLELFQLCWCPWPPLIELSKPLTQPKCIFHGLLHALGLRFNKSGAKCRP